jgi:Rnl2 family RNA ligase
VGYLEKFGRIHPNLLNDEFIIQEKLDGTNLQFLFRPNLLVQVGSREQFVYGRKDHFGILENIETSEFFQNFIKTVQTYVNKKNEILRIFGEYYAGNIQGKIDYGTKRDYVIFDIELNGELLPPFDSEQLAEKIGVGRMFIKSLEIVNGLKKALEYNEEFLTNYCQNEIKITKANPHQYTAEGIVIKPYRSMYIHEVKKDGELIRTEVFRIKKKPKFRRERERGKSAKEKKKQNIPKEFQDFNLEFQDYLTENRVENIISNNGRLKSKNEIGKYIALVLEDAWNDFLKEVNRTFTKKEMRWVRKDNNKTLASMLMAHVE